MTPNEARMAALDAIDAVPQRYYIGYYADLGTVCDTHLATIRQCLAQEPAIIDDQITPAQAMNIMQGRIIRLEKQLEAQDPVVLMELLEEIYNDKTIVSHLTDGHIEKVKIAMAKYRGKT